MIFGGVSVLALKLVFSVIEGCLGYRRDDEEYCVAS